MDVMKPWHLMADTGAILVIVLGFSAGTAPAQSGPDKKLIQELRLDANAEDFPALQTFFVGPNGCIAVPVYDDQQIRFYNSGGKKTGIFGRKGSGPGEFRNLIQRAGWIGDTLWVYDNALRRITYVSPTATLVRSEILAPKLNAGMRGGSGEPLGPEAVLMFQPSAVSAAGVITGAAMLAAGESNGALKTRSVVMTTTSDGADHLVIAPLPLNEDVSVTYRPGGGEASFTAAVPFVFAPITEYSADGNRVAFLTAMQSRTGSSYTITVLNVGRVTRSSLAQRETPKAAPVDTVFSRTYAVPVLPIARATMDSALETFGALRADGRPRFPPGIGDKLRELANGKAPQAYAPVTGLVLGLDHTTWILLRKTAAGTPAVALDERGSVVARMTVPPRARIVQASRARVWVLETDDDGLASIVRYALK
jgi:hypothetical protein